MIRQILEQQAPAIELQFSDSQLRAFETFAAELVKWNSKINLTAITSAREIAIKHFIDSLHLARHVKKEDLLLDIGSGAGLPAIPLKIVRPETAMVSVDAVAKKINFQRHIIRTLNLQKIEALHKRIEELHESHQHRFSLITSRAFTRLDNFIKIAAPLLAVGGSIIAMKGQGGDEEVAISESVLESLGLMVILQQSYELPESMGMRQLTVIKSVNPYKTRAGSPSSKNRF